MYILFCFSLCKQSLVCPNAVDTRVSTLNWDRFRTITLVLKSEWGFRSTNLGFFVDFVVDPGFFGNNKILKKIEEKPGWNEKSYLL